MADVSAALKDWSATSSSNSPSGSTSIAAGLDDNLREIQGSVVRGLSHKGADIASATTTDLGAVEGLMHDITGTTTITGFGTVRAGVWKILKFEGALTLTHNATSLIMLGGANRTTAVGDTGFYISEGSGNWRELAYFSVLSGIVGSSQNIRLATNQAISDSSGNEFIKFVLTASAVNEITITNAAAGNPPTITATGGDTDINLTLGPKGTGSIVLSGPIAGTALATQAEMETGTSTVKLVSPGRVPNHPAVPKAWGNGNYSGTLGVGYNVSSVSDNGTGDQTYNFTTSMSGAYSAVAGMESGAVLFCRVQSKAAGGVQIQTYDKDGTLTDTTATSVIVTGDLA